MVLTHCRAEELSQAKCKTCRQETEKHLPPPRFPEGGVGSQAHASTYPKQAKHAENQAHYYCIEAIGEDERKHRDNGSNGEQKKRGDRSEEHTSELQSRQYLVCRLLLEKKKKKNKTI